MAKFKVGDTVELVKLESRHGAEVLNSKIGDILEITKVVERSPYKEEPAYETNPSTNLGWLSEDQFELVKGGKKVKKAKENYIVISEDGDIPAGRTLTKEDVMSTTYDKNYYILDISKAPRYSKVTTSRMVLQKPEKKGKK